MKKLLFSLFIIAVCTVAKAQESQSVYSFLRLPVSSHVAALGGENITIIEDDEFLTLNNPALLQSVSDRQVVFGYMSYMKGTNYLNAGYAHVVNEKATVGFNAQYMNYGKMKETDALGNITGDFSASDMVLNGTLSYTLANRLVGGVTARFVYSSIASYHAFAAMADLGINYYDDEREVSLSLVAKNLGGQISAFDDNFESVHGDLQMGVSKRFLGTPFRVSVTATDLTRWNYSLLQHLTLGADLILSDQIYIAGGYCLRRAKDMKVYADEGFSENSESSHGAGLSIGAGLQLERFKLGVSYAKYHVSSSSLMLNLGFSL